MPDLRLPAGNGQWQAVRAPWKRLITGRPDVERALAKWHALDPILVATPDSARFAPPLCIPELAQRVHAGMLGRQRAVLAITGVMSLLALAAWWNGLDERGLGPVVAAFFLIFGYLAADYFFVLRHRDRTAQRTLFVYLAYAKGGRLATIATVLMLLAGLAQLYWQDRLGGLVPVVNRFGALFTATGSGEWWRYLVGPFVHASLVHWIGNLAMAMVAAGLAGILGRTLPLCLMFLAFGAGSVLAVEHLGIGHRPDALLGVSGAIFGLLGWVMGITLRERSRYPWMWLTTLMFVVLNIGLAWILVKQSSHVAHVAGFATGLALGLAGIGRQAEPVPD